MKSTNSKQNSMTDEERHRGIYRNEKISSLQFFYAKGESGFQYVPQLLKEIIDGRMWEWRLDPISDMVHQFLTLEEFVNAPIPAGLGASIKILRKLFQGLDDTKAENLLDEALQRPDGRPIKTLSIRQGFPGGTTRQRALRALRNAEDHKHLHQKVLDGEMSPHRAMKEAGFLKETFSVPRALDGLARAITRRLTKREINQLIDLLKGGV